MQLGFCGKFYNFMDSTTLCGLASGSGFEAVSLSAAQAMTVQAACREVCWTPESGLSLEDAIRCAATKSVQLLVLPAELAQAHRQVLLEAVRSTSLLFAFENGYGGEEKSPFVQTLHCIYGSIAKDLIALTDSFNQDTGSQRFFACWNTGHGTVCQQDAPAAVRALGYRLLSIHANDNHGILDYHLPPMRGRGGMDWQNFIQALHDIRFPGVFYLEINSGLAQHSQELTVRYLRMLYALGRTLAVPSERSDAT